MSISYDIKHYAMSKLAGGTVEYTDCIPAEW